MHADFINSACRHLGPEGAERLRRCCGHLDQQQIWQTPGPSLVSIGNLVQHLCGNITQYIIAGIGGAADERVRDAEFQQQGKETGAELCDRFDQVIDAACTVLRQTSPEDADRRIVVQGMEQDFVELVMHVVEHCSYHIGQISLLTKLYTGCDLGYYAGRDLNKKNA